MKTVYGTFSGKADDGFLLDTTDSVVHCIGMSPELRIHTPLCVKGSYNVEGALNVHTVYLSTRDRSVFVEYFSGSGFPGFGKKAASRFYEALHKKDISTFTREDVTELLRMLSCPQKTLSAIIEDICSLTDKMGLFESIRAFNGTYEDAEALYSLGPTAFSDLEKDPYKYVSKLSFKLIDSVAFHTGVDQSDISRVLGIISEARLHLNETGSTYLTEEEYLKACHFTESISEKYEPLPDDIFLNALIETNQGSFTPVLEENEHHVYDTHSLYVEKQIAREIYRLCENHIAISCTACEDGLTLDDDQKAALSFLETSGVKIVTGGPGSGKTTLIRVMLLSYRAAVKNGFYALAAPTGRAAARIRESSGFKATTIHKLLKFMPFSKDEARPFYTKNNQLSRGLYLIDEMSMVGEDLFLRLLEAIPTGSTVILSGDPRQLPSVDTGNVLSDVIQSGVVPVQSLTHIYRQDNSTILDNYEKILNYQSDFNYASGIFNMCTLSDENALLDTLQALREKYDRTAEGDPYTFQILSLTRKGRNGTTALNDFFCQEKRPESCFGKSTFSLQDKVIMTRNNYETGYFNGDIGIISRFDDESLYVRFQDKATKITRKDLLDVEHGDAITVHKSQGSEYETVVIVIDDQYDLMLHNAVLLTAISRAKKRVFILSMRDALSRAVRTKTPTRTTGLSYRLQEYLTLRLSHNS